MHVSTKVHGLEKGFPAHGGIAENMKEFGGHDIFTFSNYSAVVQKTRVAFDRHPGLDPGSCPTGQLPARHAMPEALEIPACAGMTC
jgi:hypothetical protein